MMDIWDFIGSGVAGPPAILAVDASKLISDVEHLFTPGAIVFVDGDPHDCIMAFRHGDLEQVPVDRLFRIKSVA